MRANKLHIFTLLGAIIFALTFWSCNICTKKVSCPEFNDETLESWFPYDAGLKLRFLSNSQLQMFTFDDVTTSGPYMSEGRGCTSNRRGSSKEVDAGGVPMFIFDLQRFDPAFNGGSSRAVNLRLLGLQFKGTDPDEEGFQQVFNESHGGMGMLKYHPSIQLGGKTFYNVQSIYFDTISNLPKAPVFKVYISRQNGLVAYETYRPVLLWVKE